MDGEEAGVEAEVEVVDGEEVDSIVEEEVGEAEEDSVGVEDLVLEEDVGEVGFKRSRVILVIDRHVPNLLVIIATFQNAPLSYIHIGNYYFCKIIDVLLKMFYGYQKYIFQTILLFIYTYPLSKTQRSKPHAKSHF